MIKPFLEALSGHIQTPPPVWFMRQAGRYLPEYRDVRTRAGGFLDLCYSPQLASEVTLQPIRRFGFDAAILFADILIVPHALGQRVWFTEGEGPKLEPIRDRAGLTQLAISRLGPAVAPILETVTRARQQLPARCALIGFAGAPWTVATYVVEGGSSRSFETLRRLTYQDPSFVDGLFEILIEASVEYLSAQIGAGAEAIQLFDTWAGVLPAADLERWCITPTRRIVEQLRRRHPGVPIIGFPRGIGPSLVCYVERTGVAAVSIDSGMPIEWVAREIQPLATVQGNLDPILLQVGGPRMIDEVRRIVDVLGRGPFVFNLGHGILPTTPPEHVAQVLETLRM